MANVIFGKITGYGYGDGSGYGYGDGSGYGYGDGDGSGYGDGDGSGSGYGDGYGYGYGSGYGDGYGDGSGSGYGSGDGDGDKAYWSAAIETFARLWPEDRRKRLTKLRETATVAYWKSSADGMPCNGGSGVPAYPGLVQEIAGPLALCGSGALHATLMPTKWKGERLWVVALLGEVAAGENKLGALKREIIAEAIGPEA